MTDTELVHRAEQAVLGAMIIQPERVSRLSSPVTPDYFTDPRHQAIFAALAGTSGRPRGLFDRLRGLFTRFGRQARETAGYMETLPEMCPDAGHVTSYVRMLADARAEREAAAREIGRNVAHATEILTDALRQLGQSGNVPAELPTDVARLARAISGKAQQLTQAQPQDAQPQRQAQPAQAQSAPAAAVSARHGGQRTVPYANQQVQGSARQAASVPPGVSGTPAREAASPVSARIGSVEDLQDHVLAALMRDQHDTQTVVEWLPAEAFGAGPRRELFSLIADFARNRDPIDPLTLAWAAERRRGEDADGAPDPDFAFRIGSLAATTSSSAQTLARMLLADHVCTASFGPDWFNSPELSRPAARTADNETVREAGPGQQTAESAQDKAAATRRRTAAHARPAPVSAAAGGPRQQNGSAPSRPPGTVGGRQGLPVSQDSATPAAPVEPPPAPAPDRNATRRQW
jgi:hypothetical protein